MLVKGKELLLDDGKKFVIAENLTIRGTNYLCLVGSDDKKTARFCKEISKEGKTYVEDVENKKELLDIMETLIKVLKKSL